MGVAGAAAVASIPGALVMAGLDPRGAGESGSGASVLGRTMVLIALTVATTSCTPEPQSGHATEGPVVCDLSDPALHATAFVVATSPAAGEHVSSPFRVAGCSSTFESNVVWELRGRDGSLLASGHTMGGGLGEPGRFDFQVGYTISSPEMAHLSVFERDESEGEGFPPGKTVLPLFLVP